MPPSPAAGRRPSPVVHLVHVHIIHGRADGAVVDRGDDDGNSGLARGLIARDAHDAELAERTGVDQAVGGRVHAVVHAHDEAGASVEGIRNGRGRIRAGGFRRWSDGVIELDDQRDAGRLDRRPIGQDECRRRVLWRVERDVRLELGHRIGQCRLRHGGDPKTVEAAAAPAAAARAEDDRVAKQVSEVGPGPDRVGVQVERVHTASPTRDPDGVEVVLLEDVAVDERVARFQGTLGIAGFEGIGTHLDGGVEVGREQVVGHHDVGADAVLGVAREHVLAAQEPVGVLIVPPP